MKYLLITMLFLSCAKQKIEPPCKNVVSYYYHYDQKWRLLESGLSFDWQFCNYEWRAFENKKADTCFGVGGQTVLTYKIK